MELIRKLNKKPFSKEEIKMHEDRKEILKRIREEVEKEKKDYKGPHCCLTMDASLKYPLTILNYSQSYREYGIKQPGCTGCMLMDYCFMCGKKLPESLRDLWFDIIRNEYKLEDPINNKKEAKLVPSEFKTDEWWKKRGL